MDTSALAGFGLTVLLVLANGFFVAAEYAFVRIRKTQLDELAQEGSARARPQIPCDSACARSRALVRVPAAPLLPSDVSVHRTGEHQRERDPPGRRHSPDG